MRAVGMTRRQTRRTVRWEAMIVSTFGAIVGIVVGTLIGIGAVAGGARHGDRRHRLLRARRSSHPDRRRHRRPDRRPLPIGQGEPAWTCSRRSPRNDAGGLLRDAPGQEAGDRRRHEVRREVRPPGLRGDPRAAAVGAERAGTRCVGRSTSSIGLLHRSLDAVGAAVAIAGRRRSLASGAVWVAWPSARAACPPTSPRTRCAKTSCCRPVGSTPRCARSTRRGRACGSRCGKSYAPASQPRPTEALTTQELARPAGRGGSGSQGTSRASRPSMPRADDRGGRSASAPLAGTPVDRKPAVDAGKRDAFGVAQVGPHELGGDVDHPHLPRRSDRSPTGGHGLSSPAHSTSQR